MTDHEQTRRTFFVGIGTIAAASFAGCVAAPEAGQSPTDDTEGTAVDSGDSTTGTEQQNSSGTEQTNTTGTEQTNTTGTEQTNTTGTGHSDEHGSELSGPSARATVSMATMDGGSHFEPHVVWVSKGGTVTWELESGAHTTTAYDPKNDRPQRIPEEGSTWDSGTLSEQGATFEQTFETVGVYDYFCLPHEGAGMVGTVIVGEPDSTDGPGLQSPQDSLPGGATEKIESLNERVTTAIGGSGGHGDGEHHDDTATDGGDGHHDDTATTDSGDGHH